MKEEIEKQVCKKPFVEKDVNKAVEHPLPNTGYEEPPAVNIFKAVLLSELLNNQFDTYDAADIFKRFKQIDQALLNRENVRAVASGCYQEVLKIRQQFEGENVLPERLTILERYATKLTGIYRFLVKKSILYIVNA